MSSNNKLQKARSTIDPLFAEHVGPIFKSLCAETSRKLEARQHTGPGAVHKYIATLADHIEHEEKRAAFRKEAFKRAFDLTETH